jgi:hypothetical protein
VARASGTRDGDTTPRGRRPLASAVGLLLVGVLAAAGYAILGAAGQDADDGLAYWLMLGWGSLALLMGGLLVRAVGVRRAVPLVLLSAALMRAMLVPLEPALSTDMYRYLWDGRVQAEGINPYVHTPEASELEHLRDEDWGPINRKWARTIYPPIAQASFLGAHVLGLRSTTSWKALISAVDVAAIALLVLALRAAGRDPRWCLAYAWNPLPIMAFGLSGHVDSLVVVLVMAATLLWWRRSAIGTGVLLGLAAGVKLFPLLLVVAFARMRDGRWRWGPALTVAGASAATLAASYLFYLSAGADVLGYLTTGYLDEEGYTSADRFRLLRALGLDGRIVVPVVALAVGVAVLRSRRPAPTRAAWLLGAAFVLTVPFSWYTTPLIALAVAGGAGWAWGGFAILLHAAYIAIFHDDVFSPLLGDLRLSTPIRNVAAGAMLVLALAAWRWPFARRAVLWQPPDSHLSDPTAGPAAVTPRAGTEPPPRTDRP